MDAAAIIAELGVTRAQADRIIRWCHREGAGAIRPVDGARKLYVERADVDAWARGRDDEHRNSPYASQASDAAPPVTVYLLDCDHGIKIGITAQTLQRRLDDLARGSGLTDILVTRTWTFGNWRGAYEVERTAHLLLRSDRTVGEWFHTHPLVAAGVIDRLVARGASSVSAFRMGEEFRLAREVA